MLKRLSFAIVILAFMIACQSSTGVWRDGVIPQANAADNPESWVLLLKEGNIKLLQSRFADDIRLFINLDDDQRPEELAGREEVGRRLLELYKNRPILKEALSQRPDLGGGDMRREIVFRVPGEKEFVFRLFSKKSPKGWEVEEIGLEFIRPPESMQNWADYNGSGRLEGTEIDDYIKALEKLLYNPHEGLSPLDFSFDLNRDSAISHVEMEIARYHVFSYFALFLPDVGPEFAGKLETNNSGWLEWDEIFPVLDFLFYAPELQKPHDVRNPMDRIADSNDDGKVDIDEIRLSRKKIFGYLADIQMPQYFEAPIYASFPMVRDWTDRDHNGRIEEEELPNLAAILRQLFFEGDIIATLAPLRLFDQNRDWLVDRNEKQRAVRYIFKSIMKKPEQLNSSVLPKIVDRDNNGKVSEDELARLSVFLGLEDHLINQKLQDQNIRKWADKNGNGDLELEEADQLVARVMQAVCAVWLRTIDQQFPVFDTETALDDLADINRDGIVDQIEYEQKMAGLFGPHPAKTQFDQAIDFEKNGQIEQFEIEKAKRAGALNLSQKRPDPDLVYKSRTAADKLLDLNRDGQVSEAEIGEVLRSVKINKVPELPDGFSAYFDLSGDGKLLAGEFLRAAKLYLTPHPIQRESELDKKLDLNNDNFIDREEIGIAAGVTDKGEVPNLFDRIEGMRLAESAVESGPASSETESSVLAEEQPGAGTGESGASTDEKAFSQYYLNLGEIQDKKLAVVSLNSTTSSIDTETADGLMVFIENAFVNVGKTTVVDRQNIQAILEENQFQLSGFTDESTAVEVGRLLGADIIVIGSISKVGEMFYLNIKLIEVETAKILGSSIAYSNNASEFLDMCNTAVFQLF